MQRKYFVLVACLVRWYWSCWRAACSLVGRLAGGRWGGGGGAGAGGTPSYCRPTGPRETTAETEGERRVEDRRSIWGDWVPSPPPLFLLYHSPYREMGWLGGRGGRGIQQRHYITPLHTFYTCQLFSIYANMYRTQQIVSYEFYITVEKLKFYML